MPRLRLRVRLPRVAVAAYWRQVAAAVLGASAVGLGGWWLYHSPMLTVQDVNVQGNVVLSNDVVRELSGLDGESLIRPDFGAAEERLLAQPIVKEAHVGRDWPNGASIEIVERSAWGTWQVGNDRFVIDNEGVVLNLPAPQGAPLILQTDTSLTPGEGQRVDIGAVRVASRLVQTAPQTLGRPVVGLEFTQARGLTAVLEGDLRVTFGDAQGYDFKIASLFAILQRADEEGRALVSVDLRFGDRVAVQ
jgi:cell division protein FtsQ